MLRVQSGAIFRLFFFLDTYCRRRVSRLVIYFALEQRTHGIRKRLIKQRSILRRRPTNEDQSIRGSIHCTWRLRPIVTQCKSIGQTNGTLALNYNPGRFWILFTRENCVSRLKVFEINTFFSMLYAPKNIKKIFGFANFKFFSLKVWASKGEFKQHIWQIKLFQNTLMDV